MTSAVSAPTPRMASSSSRNASVDTPAAFCRSKPYFPNHAVSARMARAFPRQNPQGRMSASSSSGESSPDDLGFQPPADGRAGSFPHCPRPCSAPVRPERGRYRRPPTTSAARRMRAEAPRTAPAAPRGRSAMPRLLAKRLLRPLRDGVLRPQVPKQQRRGGVRAACSSERPAGGFCWR